MIRGNGFRPYNTPVVNGTPLEYLAPTAQAFGFGQLVCQGTTGGGGVVPYSTIGAGKPRLLIMKATTGDTNPAPCFRLDPLTELIAPVASSETVISTTQIGQHICHSSSGTALCPATTGYFQISGVYNTCSVTAQYLTGRFSPFTPTTN